MPQNKAKFYLNIAIICFFLTSTSIVSSLQARGISQPQTETSYLLSREDLKTRADRLAQKANLLYIQSTTASWQQAIGKWQEALPLYRQLGDRENEANLLLMIAFTYNLLGEKQKALDYFQQTRPLFHTLGNSESEILVLNAIGVIYSSLEETQQALDYYQQALSLARSINNRKSESTTLYQIAELYKKLKDGQKSLDYYQQALSLTNDDNPIKSLILYNIALLQKELGNLSESFKNIEASISLFEADRSRIVYPQLRQTHSSNVRDFYELYIALSIELDKKNPNSGYDIKGFNASERMRGRNLLELLAESNIDIREGVDSELLQQERELNKQLDTIERSRIQASAMDANEAVKNQLDRERLNLLSQYQQLEIRIRSSSPNYANLKQPQPIELKQLKEQILDADTVLLQYSLGEQKSFVWVITQESQAIYELPSRQIIEDAAKNYYGLVSNVGELNLVNESAKKLSDIILAPINDRLTKKRIVIVGDSTLLYTSFQSLPLADFNSKKLKNLVEGYEIINLPSSSTISILRENIANKKAAPKSIAIFADPIFNFNDERIKKNNSNNRSIEESDLDRETRINDTDLDRLIGTRKEAETIAKLFPTNNRKVYLDFDANRTNATSKDLSQYKILHFATHGLLNSENPELSGIVMSLFDINGKSVNGYLRLNDIFNLSLNADLVVLSACETGLGKEVKGEGLIGLTRGFMYAGASRLVVSLWSVDDEATAELMSRFYTKMSQENISPQVALRKAQLEIQQIPKWSHPFFWAGFVIQGEWK
jgi:CHAT domain-containing protein/tetratricopeptide (TPR) repeat protein